MCEEEESNLDTFSKTINDFFTKLYAFSHWITNLSFTLLAFYIALLLQIKSKTTIPNKTTVILILVSTLVPIGIGIYLRIRYEVTDAYIRIRDMYKRVESSMDKVSKELNKISAKIMPNIAERKEKINKDMESFKKSIAKN